MFGLSAGHLFIVLLIVMLIFGPSKLPQIGRSLGSAINEFKKSVMPADNTAEKQDSQPVLTDKDKTA